MGESIYLCLKTDALLNCLIGCTLCILYAWCGSSFVDSTPPQDIRDRLF